MSVAHRLDGRQERIDQERLWGVRVDEVVEEWEVEARGRSRVE